jgi:DNA-3-methyladenine glycosylase I
MDMRCSWAGTDPLYITYHDEEWGVPVHDDRKLFEFLLLESAQAGLSWITILKKREAYREAFANFDPIQVASFDQNKINELLEIHSAEIQKVLTAIKDLEEEYREE